MSVRRTKQSVSGWPADKVERRSIDVLVPYARNARTHSEAQVDQIAASIREWGWTSPVLITEENAIIAGHGRVRAARKLGLADVPVMVATGWTKAQIRLTRLPTTSSPSMRDGTRRSWRLRYPSCRGLGSRLNYLASTTSNWLHSTASATVGLTDPDEAPEPPAVPVSRTGDIWILGRHRLLCGDSTVAADVNNVLGDVSPHLMVTDPPYGVDYDPTWRAVAGVNQNKKRLGKVANDNRADWREAWALFPGSVAYVWHAGRYASTVQNSLTVTGFEVRSQIIWAKDRFALSRGHYHWQHEPCWYAVRNGPAGWSGDRKQSTLWQIPAREGAGFEHGTQKPVECMKRPIENNSSPGQAVYEPFSGSGTTIIAAEITGRSCHAIELLPQYVDVAVERWQAFTGETAKLEQDGRTFAEVTAERRPASGDGQ